MKELLELKKDIEFVKEGAEFSEPIIMNEAYPSNPDLGEFSSVHTFIEATLQLVEDLEKLIKEVEDEQTRQRVDS